jgi:hypothetical protein
LTLYQKTKGTMTKLLIHIVSSFVVTLPLLGADIVTDRLTKAVSKSDPAA